MTDADLTIDEPTRGALARLTANEKECLRRRLRHQTAKEMALDLGISPHAVEKRLKMARTKLGLSSSLEAARLLAAAEEYQQNGPQAADLPPAPPASEKRFHRPLILGGLVMTLIAAVIIALAAQSSGGVADSGVAPYPGPSGAVAAPSGPAGQMKPDEFSMLPASEFVDGTPGELRAFAEERFREMDKDGSGFIERDEAPTPQIRLTDTVWEGKGPPPREWFEQQKSRPVPLEPVMARAAYIAKGDANADGKLSFGEYLAMRESGFDAKQVPLKWREQRQTERRSPLG
jgi:DNA-binding CsgD family transcriptional regulator